MKFEDFSADIQVLDDQDIVQVNGALGPWAIAFGLAAVFGGGATLGFNAGNIRWGR